MIYSSQQAAASGYSCAIITDTCSADVLGVQLRIWRCTSTCVPHDNYIDERFCSKYDAKNQAGSTDHAII